MDISPGLRDAQPPRVGHCQFTGDCRSQDAIEKHLKCQSDCQCEQPTGLNAPVSEEIRRDASIIGHDMIPQW